MYFGADYYPEEWPRERWETDARLMADAGFNLVRLAELAWSLVEPSPGVFEWDWLDDAIALLHRHGIYTILGTPTTSITPWLVDMDPEVTLVTFEGLRTAYGAWANNCFHSPAYRERSEIIAREMGRHYAGNPAVIAWQVDNEFGVHGRGRCYCDRCAAAFRVWLQERYGSLDALNEAWGTTFWSHVYSDWDQIPAPRKTVTLHNPGLMLDYDRFCSDTTVAYQQMQIDALRESVTSQLITHNALSGMYTHLNYFDLGESLDFISWDNYLTNAIWHRAALSHDIFRGAKRKNYWVLEQQCAYPQWAPYGSLEPGMARLMSMQGVARGADGMVYFRWRSGLIGAEQWHAGIVLHDGRTNRVYDEIKQTGQELKALSETLEGTTPRADVAIMVSYESLWALEHQPHNAAFADVFRYFDDAYQHLLRRHIPVDVVSPTGDLSPYKMVIAPAMYVLSQEAVDNLTRFVEAGGTLLATVRTGHKTVDNRVVDSPFPGLLASLVGANVREMDSRPVGNTQSVRACHALSGDALHPGALWFEALDVEDAEVLARYEEGFMAGWAAATARRVGQGLAAYLGTTGPELTGAILDGLLRDAGIEAPVQVDAPASVEVVVRESGDRRVLFLLNHAAEACTVRVGEAATDLLSGDAVGGPLALEGYGVQVLRLGA
ncbi:MAG: beta-galactosidase [Anaerolineae bacterium]